MSKLPVHVMVTKYSVSVLPQRHPDRRHFEITVEYRGNDLWAVCYYGECANAAGEWDYESVPSERADEWLKTHRFFLGEAMVLAKKLAPRVEVNGRTAGMILRAEGWTPGMENASYPWTEVDGTK